MANPPPKPDIAQRDFSQDWLRPGGKPPKGIPPRPTLDLPKPKEVGGEAPR